MSLTPLLLLPLVGGYAFCQAWTVTHYRSARESGWRVYFRATFYGAFLTACAALTHIIFFLWVPSYESLLQFAKDIVSPSHAAVSIWGKESIVAILVWPLVLGPFFGHLLSLHKLPWLEPLPFFQAWAKFVIDLAIHNNDFEKLIARSAYFSMPILFTLDGGKVYVGWAVRGPNPAEERTAVRILPLLSGYRDDQQIVRFTTEYLKVIDKASSPDTPELNHLEIGDFEVVMKYDSITSSHLFDLEAYEEFKKDERAKNKKSRSRSSP